MQCGPIEMGRDEATTQSNKPVVVWCVVVLCFIVLFGEGLFCDATDRIMILADCMREKIRSK